MTFLEWIMAGMPKGNQTPASAQPSQPMAVSPPPITANAGVFANNQPQLSQVLPPPPGIVASPNATPPANPIVPPPVTGPLTPSAGEIAVGSNINPQTGDIRRDPTTGKAIVPGMPSMVGLPDPVIAQAPAPQMPSTAPLPPPRPQAPAAYASGRVATPFKHTPPPPTPGTPVDGKPGWENYQYENDNGNLVWSQRPVGFKGAMGGTNPAGHAAQGFESQGMNQQQASAFNRVRPAGQPTGAAGPGSGVKDFFASMKAPPGVGNANPMPPGVGPAPQSAYASQQGLPTTAPLPPERPADLGVVPQAPTGDAPQVPVANQGNPQLTWEEQRNQALQTGQNIMGVTPQGQPILQGNPQAGLPDYMKGSTFANFLQLFGMTGGF